MSNFLINSSRFGNGWTYEENFTEYATQGAADAVWISSDVNYARVDIVNNWVWLQDAASVNINIYTALDFTLDNTAFVTRFKWRPLAMPSGNNGVDYILGASSVAAPTRTGASDALISVWRDDTEEEQKGAGYKDGGTVSRSMSNFTAVVDTNYWIEDIRLSATSWKDTTYSDEFSTEIHTLTQTVPSTVISLDNLALFNHAIGGASANKWATTNIQIADGVTVAP